MSIDFTQHEEIVTTEDLSCLVEDWGSRLVVGVISLTESVVTRATNPDDPPLSQIKFKGFGSGRRGNPSLSRIKLGGEKLRGVGSGQEKRPSSSFLF
jgi:hypothetical protein